MIELQILQIRRWIAPVNVGSLNIDGRRGSFPDGNHIVRGTAALVSPRSGPFDSGRPRTQRIPQSAVGVHGQGIYRLSRSGDLTHIARYRPGIEVFVSIGAICLLPVRRA